MKYLIIPILFLTTFPIHSQQVNLPREVQLVFDYMIKYDYPELLNEKPFQFRPVDWQIIDINEDGILEVFLQTIPHFRQSPTITIFQIHRNDSVSRLTEGLAPGPLVRLHKDAEILDPHDTGSAVDMQLNNNQPEKFRAFAGSALKFGMSVVLYKNFIHTDRREGKGIYIDLMYLNDFSKESSCKKFQFSKPEQIIAGKIKTRPGGFFIAKVNGEFYCYKINGFTNTGLINKEVFISEVPEDFSGLLNEDGIIRYKTIKGEVFDIVITQKAVAVY